MAPLLWNAMDDDWPRKHKLHNIQTQYIEARQGHLEGDLNPGFGGTADSGGA